MENFLKIKKIQTPPHGTSQKLRPLVEADIYS